MVSLFNFCKQPTSLKLKILIVAWFIDRLLLLFPPLPPPPSLYSCLQPTTTFQTYNITHKLTACVCLYSSVSDKVLGYSIHLSIHLFKLFIYSFNCCSIWLISKVRLRLRPLLLLRLVPFLSGFAWREAEKETNYILYSIVVVPPCPPVWYGLCRHTIYTI